ncbi:MAG TPA: alpha/beta fold hydrolase, partial [Lysobacter sp.]|nr:alpha/beta fold hydrolase [Lysobacter sp.]
MRRLLRWCLRGIVLVLVLVLIYVGASVAYVNRHEHAEAMTSAPANGRFTTVDGLAIFSQAHGAPDAPPLLLVHGTAAWSGTWFSLIPALERAGYRMIAVD